LELFLKLLVRFINNNEFVLNPMDKQKILTNRFPKTTIDPNPDHRPNSLSIPDGKGGLKQIEYKYKFKNKKDQSDPDLFEIVRRNNETTSNRPVESSSEARTVLGALMGISYGWHPQGKLFFGNARQFSTGIGYGGGSGSGSRGGNFANIKGGSDDPYVIIQNFAESIKNSNAKCTLTAINGYLSIIKHLSKKNKTIKKDDLTKINDELKSLFISENELLKKLLILGRYQQILNDLDDRSAQELTIDEIKKENNKYVNLSNKVSSKSDNLIRLLSKITGTPKSRYVPS